MTTENPITDEMEATAVQAKISLSRMRIAYELEDGTTGVVTVRSRSKVAWDMTRAKRQWPTTSDAPMFWIEFLCWHALQSEGSYAGKWEDFQNDCLATEAQDDAPADPTPQDEPAS